MHKLSPNLFSQVTVKLQGPILSKIFFHAKFKTAASSEFQIA